MMDDNKRIKIFIENAFTKDTCSIFYRKKFLKFLLKEKIYLNFIENLSKEYKIPNITSEEDKISALIKPISYISRAFKWENTKEGNDYWHTIYKKWEKNYCENFSFFVQATTFKLKKQNILWDKCSISFKRKISKNFYELLNKQKYTKLNNIEKKFIMSCINNFGRHNLIKCYGENN